MTKWRTWKEKDSKWEASGELMESGFIRLQEKRDEGSLSRERGISKWTALTHGRSLLKMNFWDSLHSHGQRRYFDLPGVFWSGLSVGHRQPRSYRWVLTVADALDIPFKCIHHSLFSTHCSRHPQAHGLFVWGLSLPTEACLSACQKCQRLTSQRALSANKRWKLVDSSAFLPLTWNNSGLVLYIFPVSLMCLSMLINTLYIDFLLSVSLPYSFP